MTRQKFSQPAYQNQIKVSSVMEDGGVSGLHLSSIRKRSHDEVSVSGSDLEVRRGLMRIYRHHKHEYMLSVFSTGKNRSWILLSNTS